NIDMTEARPKKKEKDTEYNLYTKNDRLAYFYFLNQKGMKPKQAAQAANVNHHTARKWKRQYERDPDAYEPHKK
ncbi:hypothetical protein BDF14DRAFT_1694832, partial [Spinellus fusiger]